MKKYRRMFVSSYADERFYVEKFEMGADAYREDDYEGIIERLRIVSIISSHKLSRESENLIDECDKFIEDNSNYKYKTDTFMNNLNVCKESIKEVEELKCNEINI